VPSCRSGSPSEWDLSIFSLTIFISLPQSYTIIVSMSTPRGGRWCGYSRIDIRQQRRVSSTAPLVPHMLPAHGRKIGIGSGIVIGTVGNAGSGAIGVGTMNGPTGGCFCCAGEGLGVGCCGGDAGSWPGKVGWSRFGSGMFGWGCGVGS
jgi:hypothetical protein